MSTAKERHIFLGDLHYRRYTKRRFDQDGNLTATPARAHDLSALTAVESFMATWKPTHRHYIGDMVDTNQISTFLKEPEEILGLEQDIEDFRTILEFHNFLCPDTEANLYLGNHEYRLEKYLKEHLKALRWLKPLSWSALLDATKLSLNIYQYGELVHLLPNLVVTHGETVAAKAGATANKMLDKGVSGISGHVHRLAIVPKTLHNSTLRWAENGCLCNLKPDYCTDPDWQQGGTVVYIDREHGTFVMEQFQIHNGILYYGGKEYTGRKNAYKELE